jgi:hypothetical protein
VTTVLFIPVFLLNFRSLNQWWIISSWLAVALIDPWLEEGYWRGLLMDSARGWPGWLVVAYTAFWFGLSHPLLLGVNVKALSGLPSFNWHGVHRRDLVNRIFENSQPALADSQSLCGRFAQCQRHRFLESRHFGEMSLIHQ